MTHDECLHATAGLGDYSGATCCICDDNPCSLVTVEQMRAHRLFDIYIYSDSGRLHRAPF